MHLESQGPFTLDPIWEIPLLQQGPSLAKCKFIRHQDEIKPSSKWFEIVSKSDKSLVSFEGINATAHQYRIIARFERIIHSVEYVGRTLIGLGLITGGLFTLGIAFNGR